MSNYIKNKKFTRKKRRKHNKDKSRKHKQKKHKTKKKGGLINTDKNSDESEKKIN